MIASDPALETLLLPFVSGQLPWADDALFLRARFSSTLRQLSAKHLICEQSFKPEADELQRSGLNVSPVWREAIDRDEYGNIRPAHPELVEGFQQGHRSGSTGSPRTTADLSQTNKEEQSEEKFSLILILPPRQRDEARALFASAVSLLKPNGCVIASAGNNEGARSLEHDLEQLTGGINTLSKNKCRVFWSVPQVAAINQPLLSEWLQLDQERPILNGRFISRPGVFAWDRIDVASGLLAEHLPANLSGSAADLGAGYGYLSAELLQKCTGITSLHVYEAEHRALQLAKINLERSSSQIPIEYCWHDVTAGLADKYDVIITNPPFHAQGTLDRPDIGRRFIEVAAQSLNPGGQLWLVANRHLPYEEVLAEGFDSVRMIVQQQGFKVIAAIKSSHSRQRRS